MARLSVAKSVSWTSILWGLVLLVAVPVAAKEPPALNPFAPVKKDRDDAIPGYLELSDGTIQTGNLYMTRDKRIKLYDESKKRQREIPLRVVKQIECKVKKAWMEKEWRFKEMANDEKYYTGRSYPAQEYEHVITLHDDRTITGPLSEIVYVQPYLYKRDSPLKYRADVKPLRFLLHKRNKGKVDEKLDSLVYVKRIKLGKDALEEGRKLAAKSKSKSK